MEELAADATVLERLAVVREALLLGASTRLRNMATRRAVWMVKAAARAAFDARSSD